MDLDWINALAAGASALAAFFAWRVSKRALKASQAAVLAQILKDYADRQMGTDIALLHAFYSIDRSTVEQRYRTQYVAIHQPPGAPAIEDVVTARRHVSQYFKNLVRLCDAGLIESDTVAKVFGARVFATCRDVVAPIDNAHSAVVHSEGASDDPRFGEFYKQWYNEASRSRKA